MNNIFIFVLSLAMFCTACSSTWVSTLDSILAAAAPALINILQIVAVANGQPVNSGLAAKINTDAAVIKTLVGDFAVASSLTAPGVCSQLQAAVSAYQADQGLVLQVAQVSDQNTQTKIALLADLVGGTVVAIESVIPSCQSASAAKSFRSAPPYSITTFVNRYNGILVMPTGNPAVDATTQKLRLHRHSAFLRAITFVVPTSGGTKHAQQ
jgi:hypothetical protein